EGSIVRGLCACTPARRRQGRRPRRSPRQRGRRSRPRVRRSTLAFVRNGSSIQRDSTAHQQDHDGDDEGPEIRLHPMAKRMIGIGGPATASRPTSNRTWFAESTSEWIASVEIAADPESAYAMNFATAMPMFPAKAA